MALDGFDVLIGDWTTEGTHPMVDEVVHGTVTFEWLEGRKFVIQRSHQEHELFPDAIWVIGPPETGVGLVAEYFDSRGVRRTYNVSLEDGVLRMWRDDEPDFAQRFEARLAPDEFEFVTQLAREPGEWKDDLRQVFRRA